MTITRRELADAIKNMPTDTEASAEAVVTTIIATITAGIAGGERVELRGLCSIVVADRPARIGRNPRTGAEAQIPARRVPAFRASARLRAALR